MRMNVGSGLVVITVMALASLLAGCSGAMANGESAASGDAGAAQQLPFQKDAAATASSRILAQKPLVIPSGTAIDVRLQQSLSSATAVTGQSFQAVLAEPLVMNGEVVAPRYAPVTGRVLGARKSGRLHNAGFLRLGLSSITINGDEVPVQTSSVFAHGGSYKKRNTAWIGGGAAGGALIGALAGGGKGALIGSAVGAGAGTTAAYATGKKEVGYAVERRLSFRLTHPLSINR